jgi:hypothetical protein
MVIEISSKQAGQAILKSADHFPRSGFDLAQKARRHFEFNSLSFSADRTNDH